MFDKFLYIHTSLCMYFFLGAINDSFVWSNSDLKKLFDSGEFGDYLLVGEYLLFLSSVSANMFHCSSVSLHVTLIYAHSEQSYSDVLYITLNNNNNGVCCACGEARASCGPLLLIHSLSMSLTPSLYPYKKHL